MAASSATTSDQGEASSISTIHPDILQTHVLTRLDGLTLTFLRCTSLQFRSFSYKEKLWGDICKSTYPSTSHPLVQGLISSFPGGYHGFFSDSFPLLTACSSKNQRRIHVSRPFPTAELVSAIDIHFGNKLIMSKVQEVETSSGWFQFSPFRIDLLDPKESLHTPIRIDEWDETWQRGLEEGLTLSWIIIDPTRERAANFSSLTPVSVQRHWLTGDVRIEYTTILGYDRCGLLEFVECKVVVACGVGKRGELNVKEVFMQVEDMDGKQLNGKDSYCVLTNAIEHGKRKKGERHEGKGRYQDYLVKKRERIDKRARMERILDMVGVGIGALMFPAFCFCFVCFRWIKGSSESLS